jgi:hypothetical protein
MLLSGYISAAVCTRFLVASNGFPQLGDTCFVNAVKSIGNE